MNRMVALLPLALLAACSKAAEQGEPSEAASSEASAAQATAQADPAATAAAAPGAVAIDEDGKLFHFAYSYPANAAGIPALRAELEAEKDKARTELVAQAKDGQKESKEGGYEYHPYDTVTEWTVVTDIPGWLSMKGEFYSFTGGAHGNSGTQPLLWDKAANRRREPIALFISPAALNAALGPAYCAALNAERSKRRQEKVDPNSGDEFDKCLAPSEVTILLGSGDKAHFTRIGLIADPYMAGPYAEGDYEITLPVNAAVLKAVKPEYRSMFAVGR
ncbi:MAG: DUF4163 domain-containing protein [Novosphingobium sp.]|uniref:DUF4163 domain-containing protein n=1 Tax=Novosphingobium sp. TaxID=1874826 RepID=UPI003C7D3A5E